MTAGRNPAAVPLPLLTRRFYRRFREQQAAVAKAIRGIGRASDRSWYATLTLTRLMLLSFLQSDGLLDADPRYLRRRFVRYIGRQRADSRTFFRGFLLPLFHHGLGRHPAERRPASARHGGDVPRLDSGLFGVHPLERGHPRLDIGDEAFPAVFDFLDHYAWRYRETASGHPREITPDILGHVFEKFVNQRQMGAYYTRDDITDYIARMTLLPALLDAVTRCPGPRGERCEPPWQLAAEQPDRYIPDVVGGSRRRELQRRLRSAVVRRGSDWVTLNLDIALFVRDALLRAPDLQTVLAWYAALTRLTVLDPACGSGAFLFAAIRTLVPVGQACLERMQTLLRAAPARSRGSARAAELETREILRRVAQAPSLRYFVLRLLMQQNLHGVDVMPEAAELCRLRLLLKLIAEIPGGDFDQLPSSSELGIRVGDTLRGRLQPPRGSSAGRPAAAGTAAFDWHQAFPAVMQQGGFAAIVGNPPYIRVSPQRIPRAVRGTRTEGCPDLYAWCMERAADLGSPHCRVGMILPLSLAFSRDFAPLRRLLQDEYAENWFSHFGRIPSALFSHDVRIRNTIHLGAREASPGGSYTTRLHRWFDEDRDRLFASLQYAPFHPQAWPEGIPKLGAPRLADAWQRALDAGENRVAGLLAGKSAGGLPLYFKKTAYNWLAFSRRPPPCYDGAGRAIDPPQVDTLAVSNPADADLLFLLLNGKLVFIHWSIVGDDFHVTRSSLMGFPVPQPRALRPHRRRLADLARELERAMQDSLCFKDNAGKRVGSYNLARCRHVTDRGDRLLAPLLGLDGVWDEIQALYADIVKTDFSGTPYEGRPCPSLKPGPSR